MLCFLVYLYQQLTILLFISLGLDNPTSTRCTIDNNSAGYVTLYPDTLISGTTISTGISCPRRAVLSEQFKTEFQNEVMLIGTILHDLFDWVIEKRGR